jgi:hypothetical protein
VFCSTQKQEDEKEEIPSCVWKPKTTKVKNKETFLPIPGKYPIMDDVAKKFEDYEFPPG